MRVISRYDVAASGVFPHDVASACMTVLARDPRMHEYLAANACLPSDVWVTVWGTRPPARRAEMLAGRALSERQREMVLDKEARVGVLAEFVRANELSVSEQRVLLAKASPGVAEVLLERPWLDVALRKEAALASTPAALLREVAYDPYLLFDDDEAAALVGYADEVLAPIGARQRSACLRALLFHRPSIVSRVIATSGRDAVTTAAAGSLTLSAEDASRIGARPSGESSADLEESRFTLMALVANPVVPLSVVQQVRDSVASAARSSFALRELLDAADRRLAQGQVLEFRRGEPLAADGISWLCRRGMPSDFGPGREVELLVVCLDVSVSEDIRGQAWQALLNVGSGLLLARHAQELKQRGLVLPVPREREPASRRDPLQDTWDLLSRELGANRSRWEAFLGLVEEFDGSLEDLVAVSAAL